MSAYWKLKRLCYFCACARSRLKISTTTSAWKPLIRLFKKKIELIIATFKNVFIFSARKVFHICHPKSTLHCYILLLLFLLRFPFTRTIIFYSNVTGLWSFRLHFRLLFLYFLHETSRKKKTLTSTKNKKRNKTNSAVTQFTFLRQKQKKNCIIIIIYNPRWWKNKNLNLNRYVCGIEKVQVTAVLLYIFFFWSSSSSSSSSSFICFSPLFLFRPF